jgi:hypothetical protein
MATRWTEAKDNRLLHLYLLEQRISETGGNIPLTPAEYQERDQLYAEWKAHTDRCDRARLLAAARGDYEQAILMGQDERYEGE